MKKKSLLVCLLVLISGVAAYAAFPASQTARIKFSTTPVLTSAYVQLISSLTRPTGSVTMWNSATVPLQLAIGAAGSEQVILTVPAVSATAPSSQSVARYDLVIPAGQRLSVIALDSSTGTVGEVELNCIFN